MNLLYFAYGANMNIESMAFRCPAARPVQTLCMRDWRLRFYSHATIEPCVGAEVAGVLWQITPECEVALDIFEGHPVYYTKRIWQQDGQEFFFYEMQYPQGHSSPGYIKDIARSYGVWQLPQHCLREALQEHDEALRLVPNTDLEYGYHS